MCVKRKIRPVFMGCHGGPPFIITEKSHGFCFKHSVRTNVQNNIIFFVRKPKIIPYIFLNDALM